MYIFFFQPAPMDDVSLTIISGILGIITIYNSALQREIHHHNYNYRNQSTRILFEKCESANSCSV